MPPFFTHAALMGFDDATFDMIWLFVKSNLAAIALIAFALLVVERLLVEKRAPSNIFAWGLAILFVPPLGIPLFLLFGGRKSRRLVRRKLAVQRMAYRFVTGREPPPLGKDDAPMLPSLPHAGNTFSFLPDGAHTYRALLEHIARAKKRIYIETFILGRDDIAKTVLDKLAERAAQGVEVRLLIDAAGSRGAWKYTKGLRRAGGHVARFLPRVFNLKSTLSANLRNHRKIAVFDDDIAIVGGQNIEERGIGPACDAKMNVDFSAVIEGPVVGTFLRTFLCDWCFAAKEDPRAFAPLIAYRPPPRGTHTMQAIASGPDMAGDLLWERILLLINAARGQCTVVTPYFVPDEVTFRILELKAKAGGKVRLIVPERSNQALVDLARNAYLRALEKAGCEILLYRGAQMVHAKLFIGDGTALMGSVNLDMRSLFVNFEVGLMLDSADAVDQLENWVGRALLPHCVPYAETPQAHTGKLRRFAEDLARLIAPLL